MTRNVPANRNRVPEKIRPVTPGRPLPHLAMGGNGHLRADTAPVIDASNDLEAIAFWLWERAGDSQTTKDSYWLHIERLLLWASEVKAKSLSELTVNDFAEYRDFLCDPQPREVWCGPRAPRGSPRWKPFKGPLSPASQRLSMRIISSLVNFLCAAGYLKANPLALLRKPKAHQERPGAERTIERFLDESLVGKLMEHIDSWPRETRRQKAEYERTRWVFTLLLSLGLRRDEVVRNPQSAFEKRLRPNSMQWWVRILGKGSKERVIPLPEACVRGLTRYRQSLGLPIEPAPDEDTPMVCHIGALRPVSDTTLYRIVKTALDSTALAIEADDPHGAHRIRQASPHWLRHSFVTSQGNLGVSLKHRGKSAGHASIETTARYDHAVDDEWHKEMQRSLLDDWV